MVKNFDPIYEILKHLRIFLLHYKKKSQGKQRQREWVGSVLLLLTPVPPPSESGGEVRSVVSLPSATPPMGSFSLLCSDSRTSLQGEHFPGGCITVVTATMWRVLGALRSLISPHCSPDTTNVRGGLWRLLARFAFHKTFWRPCFSIAGTCVQRPCPRNAGRASGSGLRPNCNVSFRGASKPFPGKHRRHGVSCI